MAVTSMTCEMLCKYDTPKLSQFLQGFLFAFRFLKSYVTITDNNGYQTNSQMDAKFLNYSEYQEV